MGKVKRRMKLYEYAAHQNVSQGCVSTWIRKGWIARDGDGLIPVYEADKALQGRPRKRDAGTRRDLCPGFTDSERRPEARAKVRVYKKQKRLRVVRGGPAGPAPDPETAFLNPDHGFDEPVTLNFKSGVRCGY